MTISKGNHQSGIAQPDSPNVGTGSTIRPVEFNEHPIVLHSYNCSTLQMEELAARMTGWISAGVQQAVIFAPAGTGKTHCIRHLNRQLSAKFPDVVFTELHAASVLGTAGRDHSFLRKQVMKLIDGASHGSVVLWIDDSQLLTQAAEDSLRCLRDQLSANEVRLLTVLVGHPRVRVMKQRRVSYASDFPSFVPVVPTEEYELHGLRSVTEIEHCLKAYDNDCFPIGSDWSYTRFFLPQAYLNGFRLSAYARDLWHVFVDADRTSGADSSTEVPMLYFARTIEHALIEGSARDRENMVMNRQFWKRAVLYSGWKEGRELQRDLARESYVADAIC